MISLEMENSRAHQILSSLNQYSECADRFAISYVHDLRRNPVPTDWVHITSPTSFGGIENSRSVLPKLVLLKNYIEGGEEEHIVHQVARRKPPPGRGIGHDTGIRKMAE